MLESNSVTPHPPRLGLQKNPHFRIIWLEIFKEKGKFIFGQPLAYFTI